jgi:integrase
VYGKTKAEVIQKMTKLKTAALTGIVAEPDRLSVAQYLDRWLEDAARPRIQPGTYQLYSRLITKHINPHIGGIRLTNLTPGQVQGLYSDLERLGRSPRLRQQVHNMLHKALKQATLWNIVPRNVTDAVARPAVPKKAMKYLSPDQVKAFLTVAKASRFEALFVLAVTTGLRQGELLGLQWSDIDLDAGALSVHRALKEESGVLRIDQPKTSKSRRRVELPAFAVAALRKHQERLKTEGLSECQWVFPDTEGGLMRRNNLGRRNFHPLLEMAGLPRIRFHDLRHTAATLLLAQGVHPKVVQERLGHATVGLTLDTYSHLLPSMQRDAADKLDALLLPPDEET